MNSCWNKNITLFQNRFPELAHAFLQCVPTEADISPSLRALLVEAKNGSVTLYENGIYVHSRYNPEQEAHKWIVSSEGERMSALPAAVFFGMGLAYAPCAFCRTYPDSTVILVEPSFERFAVALASVDLTALFEHLSLFLLVGADEHTVFQMLSPVLVATLKPYAPTALVAHARSYFAHINTLIERNKQKDEINARTLDRFGARWLRNMCRNMTYIRDFDGVHSYEGRAPHLQAFVLAAGPSLDEILPLLSEIKKRFVLICVDTALRACLSCGVQPDFIVLVDPQYWNFCHLLGLSAPESILITEVAAYPAVFRFPCRKKILCSSQFSLSRFIENRIGVKGALGTGGSVATTAWDFARLIGCRTIIVGGLDLAFPHTKTHFKGSTFEERAHLYSTRIHPAESDSYHALYAAHPFLASNYKGGTVLTDTRMSLYAWWFESKCAQYPTVSVHTVSAEGLCIPGIKVLSYDELQAYPENRTAITAFLQTDSCQSASVAKEFERTVEDLRTLLQDFERQAQKAVALCETGIQLLSHSSKNLSPHIRTRLSDINDELSHIDCHLLDSEAKEFASLIFPSPNRLALSIPATERNDTSPIGVLRMSKYTYQAVVQASKKHLSLLFI